MGGKVYPEAETQESTMCVFPLSADACHGIHITAPKLCHHFSRFVDYAYASLIGVEDEHWF